MSTTYNIKLPQFEGPFDLLLFFIERDELDIHDIPIAQITEEFLNYIRQMESLNIDLASEFILVAATLMGIKAKLLIPRKPLDEEGNEIDPRGELVLRLLEYKRYKSVLEEMRGKEEDRNLRTPRGNASYDISQVAAKALVDLELESLTLFKLMKAFDRVMNRLNDKKPKMVHQVFRYNQTVPGQQIFILSRVKKGTKTGFADVFGLCKDRMHALITFLALLELLNMQRVTCISGIGINNFWLTVPEEEPVMSNNDNEEEGEFNDEEE